MCMLSATNYQFNDKSFKFFNALCMNILSYQSLGKILIFGDFNARCGNKIDNNACYINRLTCDTFVNGHGQALIDFLDDIDFCIVNGRLGDSSNKFTSISHRGSAIVDYCIADCENLSPFRNFDVLLVHDFVDKYNRL